MTYKIYIPIDSTALSLGANDVFYAITAEAKKRIMSECGIHVVNSPAAIGKKVAEILN